MNDCVLLRVPAVCPFTCTDWHGRAVEGSSDDIKSEFLVGIVVILTFGTEHDLSDHHMDLPAFANPRNESANLRRIEQVSTD